MVFTGSATTQVSTGIGSVEVDSSDVVRLMLQFMLENGESGIALNAVERRESLVAEIRAGKWALVLPVIGTLELPKDTMLEVYEHIALELIEMKEPDVARELMRTAALRELQAEAPERYARLERLLSRCKAAVMAGSYGSSTLEDVWMNKGDGSKDARRAAIADEVSAAIGDVKAARLATLIGEALRWRAHAGLLASGRTRVDVFKESAGGAADKAKGHAMTAVEKPANKRAAGAVRFGAESRPLCCAFLPEGTAVVTGSSDGFVEIWDAETCRLRKDLPYQAAEELLMHDEAVLCLAPSTDGEALASGDKGGTVKVFRLAVGDCVRKFDKAHAAGVTAIAWSRDGSQVVSGAADGAIKAHGLKSARQLQQFRGHASYVTALCFAGGASRALAGDALVSCGADGTVRLWDARSSDCLASWSPAGILASAERRVAPAAERERAVVAVLNLPASDKLVVVDRSPTALMIDLRGDLVHTFSTKDPPNKVPATTVTPKPGAAFVAAALSKPRSEWLYGLADDGNLYCFSTKTAKLERISNVAPPTTDDVSGVATHPHRSLAATFGDGDQLKLWKS